MSCDAEIDPRIMAKIKKCLALATSDNPNEAATALRQAHALMSKHGVSAQAITMADIGEAEVSSRTMSRNKPAQWEAVLASLVGKAFGCKMMVKRMVLKESVLLQKRSQGVVNQGSFVFVGLKSQVEIASYTAQVLARKCQRARANWIKEQLSGLSSEPGGKRKTTALGDQFAMGWVYQISRLVHDFAQPNEVEHAIADHIASKTKGDGGSFLRESKGGSDTASALALRAGVLAADGEHLHRPVDTRQPQKLLC